MNKLLNTLSLIAGLILVLLGIIYEISGLVLDSWQHGVFGVFLIFGGLWNIIESLK